MVFGFGKIDKEKIDKMENRKDVKGLIKALKNKDPYIRKSAATALANVGGSQAVDPLINALNDEDKYVIANSSLGLSYIGDPRALEPLIQVMISENRNQYTRDAIIQIIQRNKIKNYQADERLIHLLSNEDYDAKIDASMILGELEDPRAIEPLKKVVNGNDPAVNFARKALMKIEKPNIPELEANRDIKALIELLNTDLDEVRIDSVKALGNIGDPIAVKPLINVLENNYYKDIGSYAADSLGEIGDSTAASSLIKMLRTPYNKFETARSALIKINDPDPLIEEGLKDPDWQARMFSAQILGEIGDSNAIEPLINAANNEKDPKTRSVIVDKISESLRKLNDRENDEDNKIKIQRFWDTN